ncbi:MAG: endopeptidase La [Gammaproteobacteria bacterium]|nr:endopeptidase La [Gammaproteobacteria bacterium]
MTDHLSPLPILPLKDIVVFPHIVAPLAVGRPRSLAAIQAAADRTRMFLAVAQRESDTEDPTLEQLYAVATLVTINRIEKRKQGAQVIVQGERRVRLIMAGGAEGYLSAHYELLPELTVSDDAPDAAEVTALLRENRQLSQQIAKLYDAENGDQIYQQLVGSIQDPVAQMYRIASLANLSVAQQQEMLDKNTTRELLQGIHDILQHEQRVTQLRREIAEKAQGDLEQQQREHVLRQQKKAIEQALGENDEDDDLDELRARLDAANLPENVQTEVNRELKRLKRMSANAADYQVSRSYLELIAELPWHARTTDLLDLANAQKVLDEDHYGLADVKERILETLAVMRLNPEAKAPIMCLVGPPGVGKTSLGQSIARAMGRKFERLSLGGLHDEAELRGHRRTYIGAMPGRILQAVRRTGVQNSIIMLDEIDKLGRDFRGDPAAALMEILDPAQNREFQDNYLNLPFDLSGVLFITTANTLDGIPRPLLDRMEVLDLSGYSDFEKLAIARQYLIPRQQKEAGLVAVQFRISDEALTGIIRRYTREAGVRELERMLGRLARKRARSVVEQAGGERWADYGGPELPEIDLDSARQLLGPERFKAEQGRTGMRPGIATGLAWTEAGGDVLYIEVSLVQKDEKITLTGHLGQVMQESARAARSHIWAMAESLGLDRTRIENSGVHVHVPAGAVPKDGPSAGVTMATAMVSAFLDRPVRDDVAMTGELTLAGLVLPVGGIKEKVLAAHRAGIRHVLLPRNNEADLQKLPEAVKGEMNFTLLDRLEDALKVAISPAGLMAD